MKMHGCRRSVGTCVGPHSVGPPSLAERLCSPCVRFDVLLAQVAPRESVPSSPAFQEAPTDGGVQEHHLRRDNERSTSADDRNAPGSGCNHVAANMVAAEEEWNSTATPTLASGHPRRQTVRDIRRSRRKPGVISDGSSGGDGSASSTQRVVIPTPTLHGKGSSPIPPSSASLDELPLTRAAASIEGDTSTVQRHVIPRAGSAGTTVAVAASTSPAVSDIPSTAVLGTGVAVPTCASCTSDKVPHASRPSPTQARNGAGKQPQGVPSQRSPDPAVALLRMLDSGAPRARVAGAPLCSSARERRQRHRYSEHETARRRRPQSAIARRPRSPLPKQIRHLPSQGSSDDDADSFMGMYRTNSRLRVVVVLH